MKYRPASDIKRARQIISGAPGHDLCFFHENPPPRNPPTPHSPFTSHIHLMDCGGETRSLDMLMLMADAAAAAVNGAAPSAETTLLGEEAELTILRRRLKATENSELAALQAKGAVKMELAATQKELTACMDRASSRADDDISSAFRRSASVPSTAWRVLAPARSRRHFSRGCRSWWESSRSRSRSRRRWKRSSGSRRPWAARSLPPLPSKS